MSPILATGSVASGTACSRVVVLPIPSAGRRALGRSFARHGRWYERARRWLSLGCRIGRMLRTSAPAHQRSGECARLDGAAMSSSDDVAMSDLEQALDGVDGWFSPEQVARRRARLGGAARVGSSRSAASAGGR